MKITKTKFGLYLIDLNVLKDNRGLFFELFNKSEIIDFNCDFVQDNVSISKYGVLRGLHFQDFPMQQSKLITVLKGEIFDVVVDIMIESNNFGKFESRYLRVGQSLYIPHGFAHGFQSLAEESIISYKCDNYYSKQHEKTIIYNDKDIGIAWPIEPTEMSEKDKNGIFLKQLL